eukprot:1473031-Rhodomonas_salina.2
MVGRHGRKSSSCSLSSCQAASMSADACTACSRSETNLPSRAELRLSKEMTRSDSSGRSLQTTSEGLLMPSPVRFPGLSHFVFGGWTRIRVSVLHAKQAWNEWPRAQDGL